VLKKIGFHESRYKATLRAEFFDVFNRHHLNGPNTGNIGAQYFGNVTGLVTGDSPGALGHRYGQVGARFEW